MTADPKLNDEPARIAALHRYEVLDTPAEAPFDKITNLVRAVLGVPISAVSLIDSDRQWFKSHPGIDAEETTRDIAFCDHTIRSRNPLIVADASLDDRFKGNPLVMGDPNIGSYAGVPLETPDGYNIGSLCAIDTRPRHFDPAQIDVLKRLAALVVDQLELRRIAERDYLTGALTRRAFVAELDRAIALHKRHERPAALVLIDIDHFKAVNDSHGHPAGDRAICALVDCVSGMKRPSDVFGRIGGEEFGLLLPETSQSDAFQAAERYREAVVELIVANGEPFGLTASFGVAGLMDADSELWFERADGALYDAKRSGRNRVCVAKPELDRTTA
ncbi:sensor domain-containing diguanylate cyclase [Sphingobium boeckii]|uniref:diguanylate cyclase n=1 Tax=Sphingobium boeckii TaxID=1082345 RepID=A0A7W9AK62_9SPHN|nr:sensor domain-containing diguanylate cyclase [Sphingobium boeckii]MBB5687188.1 diguanylate cyclase (GGDEF)-like protein [Sphingobium boeckii]